MSALGILLLAGAAFWCIRQGNKKSRSIGKLTDRPLDLENILMGVSRKWYTARTEELAGWGYVVWLSGKKANGEYTEDVYPISKETYEALRAQGIGATKRRIYEELAEAQRSGINLYDGYDPDSSRKLLSLADRYNYRGSSRSSKSLSEQYYNNLRRAYNAIAATDLPYRESVVYNNRGDEIIRYRDYGSEAEKLKAAIEELSAGVSESSVYWYIVGLVARGAIKLLWTLPEKELQKGNRGLQEELFGRKAPAERKLFRRVLATKDKGGITPSRLAHSIWEGVYDRSALTDMEIRDILLDALRDYHDPKAAKEALLNQYYSAHQEQDVDYFARDPEEQTRMFEDFTGDDEMPF